MSGSVTPLNLSPDGSWPVIVGNSLPGARVIVTAYHSGRACTRATFGDLLTYGNELFHVSVEVHSENETAKRKNPFPAQPNGLLMR